MQSFFASTPAAEHTVGLEIIVGVAAGIVLAAVLITRLAKRR